MNNDDLKKLKPKNYGNIWEWKKHDYSWYKWMHNILLKDYFAIISTRKDRLE